MHRVSTPFLRNLSVFSRKTCKLFMVTTAYFVQVADIDPEEERDEGVKAVSTQMSPSEDRARWRFLEKDAIWPQGLFPQQIRNRCTSHDRNSGSGSWRDVQ